MLCLKVSRQGGVDVERLSARRAEEGRLVRVGDGCREFSSGGGGVVGRCERFFGAFARAALGLREVSVTDGIG